MGKPNLSVVVVTNRVGGLDALLAGLERQTYREFELVLVDELGAYRPAKLPASFPLRHLGPEPGAARWGNYMRALNRGIAASLGERFVFWADYTCAHPETLALHAEGLGDANAILLGDIEYTCLPPLSPRFPLRYGWLAMGHDQANEEGASYAPWLDDKRRHELYEEWRSAYEEDLAAGVLDAMLFSTFAEPMREARQAFELPLLPNGAQSRVKNPHLNLKNDSISKALLDSIGGFDERADGSHGHQDSMTAPRLLRAGGYFKARPGSPVRLLDPHNLMIIRRMDWPDTDNLRLCQEVA